MIDRIRKRTSPPRWVGYSPAWSLRVKGVSGAATYYSGSRGAASEARLAVNAHMAAGGWSGAQTLADVIRRAMTRDNKD